MPHPVFKPGATALITGGASGVGLAIAKYSAGYGMNIALVDINSEKLAAAKSELSASSPLVETYVVDVSKAEAWAALRSSVEGQFSGGVDLLVLNAGTAVKHGVSEAEAFHTIFDTNFFGYVHGLAAFLPALKGRKDSAVVLTGSKQGITNPPGNPAYNASKAAVRSLAEQVSFDAHGSATSVHLLVPGWTFTGMTGGGGSVAEKPAGAWAPEQVADFLGKKMEAGSFYVICPDNDVTEDLDKRRMLWSTGDVVYDRPPLSRWRDDWKEKAQQGIDSMKI